MFRKLFVFQLLLVAFIFTEAGTKEIPSLKADFHAERRVALRSLMPDNSVSIFFTYPIKNRSNDIDYKYKANPDFYYLSGYDQQDAVLFVFKNEQKINGIPSDHLLLIPPKDLNYETWNGERLSIGEAKRKLKLISINTTDIIKSLPVNLLIFNKVLVQYQTQNSFNDLSENSSLQKIVNDFNEVLERDQVSVNKTAIKKWMAELRQVKQENEIALIQFATNATGKGIIEAMKAVEPGMTEKQVQAIIEFYFKIEGSEYPGFPSIIGSGENACILHYTENNATLKENELLVMDVGAEIQGYSSDITRTIPVNGVFSDEQKAIYDLVLKAQKAGIDACKTKNPFNAPHTIAKEIISDGLIKLGVISENNQVNQYFMHGTSHYLGMDVHDVGTYGPLSEGMIITVEPGIYIKAGSPCDQKWWNIGVRIEDDILITRNNPINLSGFVPKEVKEIEELMKKESPFNHILKTSKH